MTTNNGTTLTRERLLQVAARRYEVVDVEGFGRVGIKAQGALQRSRRLAERADPKTGRMIPEMVFLENLHAIIDQVMIDETTPMFSDKDIVELGQMDPFRLEPLVEAIAQFNEPEEKKDVAESSDTAST